MPGEVKKESNAIWLGPFTAGEALTKGEVVYIKASDGEVYIADAAEEQPKFAINKSFATGATDVYIAAPPTIISLEAGATITPGSEVEITGDGEVIELVKAVIGATFAQAEVQGIEINRLSRVGRALNTADVTIGNDVDVMLGV